MQSRVRFTFVLEFLVLGEDIESEGMGAEPKNINKGIHNIEMNILTAC